MQGGASRPFKLLSPPLKRVHSGKSLAFAVSSHTPSQVLIWATVIFHPPQSKGCGFTVPRPPAPPHTHSKEKCPRPAVFLLSAFAIEYPLSTLLFPPSSSYETEPRPKTAKDRCRETRQPPSHLQRHSLGPRARPHPSQAATAAQASARPELPIPGSDRSLTQEGARRGSGGSHRYGGTQPGRR